MRELGIRILKRSLIVGLILAALGYIFAQIFLWSHRYYGGGGYDPANECVLWNAPLRMAILGVVIIIVVETIRFALRRKLPKPPSEGSPNP